MDIKFRIVFVVLYYMDSLSLREEDRNARDSPINVM